VASDRTVRTIGWLATVAGILMYLSYVDQIRLNLAGEKGSAIQPLFAAASASLWSAYGLFRRDWPILACNAPGILLGLLASATAV
jgi:uncharacterized protein with PQ loop repeat